MRERNGRVPGRSLARPGLVIAIACAIACAIAGATACDGRPVPPVPVGQEAFPAGGAAPGLAAPGSVGSGLASRVAPLEGRVDLALRRRSVQAAAAKVVDTATVSLVDLASGATIAGGKTASDGAFTLALGNAQLAVGTPYLLEASKGLLDQKPGGTAVRFRTFVKWDGSAWHGISRPQVVISALTTAVAIASGLDPDRVRAADTFGTVDAGVSPPALVTNPDFPGHPDDDLYQLSYDILEAVAGDADPVAAIGAIVPALSGVSAAGGKAYDPVVIDGVGFSPFAAGNTVKIGGATAPVLAASPTRLVVSVPPGAAAGPGTVTVSTRRGTGNALPFGVEAAAVEEVRVTAVEPSEALPGARITIHGTGFSGTAGENTVSFAAANASMASPGTAASSTSLVVTVPDGAVSGGLSVTSPKGRSNPVYFRVPPHIAEVSPASALPGHAVTIRGARLGQSAGTVRFGGVPGVVVSWTENEVKVNVPIGGRSGPLALEGERGAAIWPAFEVASPEYVLGSNADPGLWWLLGGSRHADQGIGTITWWPDGVNDHSYAPVARVGKYVYAFGNHIHTYVDRAPVRADGTLGAWERAGNLRMPAVFSAKAAVVAGRWVYIVGGHYYPPATGGDSTPSGECNNGAVQAAEILDADGNLGPFNWVSGLPHAVDGHTTHVIGRYLYAIGGNARCGDDGGIHRMQRVGLRADGTLDGNFTNFDNFIDGGGTWLHSSEVVGKYLYTFGGNGDRRIRRATLKPDGTFESAITTWGYLPSTGRSDEEFSRGTSIVLGNKLFLFYGYAAAGYHTPRWILESEIQPNGDLGPFRHVGSTTYQHGHPGGAILAGSFLYLVGSAVEAIPIIR